MKFWPPKDPDETLDYDIDWSERLDTADTITNSTWTIDGTDALLITSLDNYTDTATKIWLEAGTLGEVYEITNQITTSGGRIMDQTVRLRIKAK